MNKKTGVMTWLLLTGFTALLQLTAAAAPGYETVASTTDRAKGKTIGKYGMTPIRAEDIKEGTYVVEVDSSSTFFRILEAELTVKDETMEAVLSMSSSSYLYVYMGTAQEAANAPLSDYIPLVEEAYSSSFTIPVEALNTELNCAAYSRKKEKWYDRKLLIDASALPQDALTFQMPDYERIEDALNYYDKMEESETKESETEQGAATQAMDEIQSEVPAADGMAVDQKDGAYSIEVSLTGGSGRASVSSPAWFYVREGKAWAKLLWSSPYYDYMKVGDEIYRNETTDGSNSTFTIPVAAMDSPMDVVADTTAMGDPLEIEYTLTFYGDTIGGTGLIPQEAAKKVLIIALVIIVAGGILNSFVKRKKGQ